jgi:hypothetical protein
MLAEPTWATDPRLNRWVFATLMPIVNRDRRLTYGPSQVWWLEIDVETRSIVAAGRLTQSRSGESGPVEERCPSVAIGSGGEIRLVYLERQIPGRTYRLRSVTLEFDPRTGRPKGLNDVQDPVPGPLGELLPVPLVVSADGATVYGLRRSGGPVALPLVSRVGQSETGAGIVRGVLLP